VRKRKGMPSTFESKGEENKSKSKKKIDSAKITQAATNPNPNPRLLWAPIQQHQ
jgi:hypothetical protein